MRGLYPEQATYVDTGCRHHPACLTCPFETCLLEGGREAWKRRVAARHQAIAMKARRDGVNNAAVAFGLTRRSVFRILAEQGREARKLAAKHSAVSEIGSGEPERCEDA